MRGYAVNKPVTEPQLSQVREAVKQILLAHAHDLVGATEAVSHFIVERDRNLRRVADASVSSAQKTLAVAVTAADAEAKNEAIKRAIRRLSNYTL